MSSTPVTLFALVLGCGRVEDQPPSVPSTATTLTTPKKDFLAHEKSWHVNARMSRTVTVVPSVSRDVLASQVDAGLRQQRLHLSRFAQWIPLPFPNGLTVSSKVTTRPKLSCGNRYYGLLIDEARRFLAKRPRPRRWLMRKDILQNVFESVFRRAERGDYPDLCNRNELWRLLITITERKVINQVKFETRLVRGGYRKQFSLPSSRSRSNRPSGWPSARGAPHPARKRWKSWC